jgi:hypothetical protein
VTFEIFVTMVVKRTKKTENKTDSAGNEDYKESKIRRIQSCLEKSEVNLWELREFALTKGGLINGKSF